MDLSIAPYVPWTGIIVGTVLSLITLFVGVGAAIRNTSDRDYRYSDIIPPYVLTAVVMVVAIGGSVGFDLWTWEAERGGSTGILRSEADRVYGIELSTTEAEALEGGSVLVLLDEDENELVVRLDGDELVTVGDWVPLER